VVIVKGQFYSASMITNNDLELQKTNNEEVLLSRSYHEYNNSVIRILSHENLKDNIQNLKKQCDEFFEMYGDILKENISRS